MLCAHSVLSFLVLLFSLTTTKTIASPALNDETKIISYGDEHPTELRRSISAPVVFAHHVASHPDVRRTSSVTGFHAQDAHVSPMGGSWEAEEAFYAMSPPRQATEWDLDDTEESEKEQDSESEQEEIYEYTIFPLSVAELRTSSHKVFVIALTRLPGSVLLQLVPGPEPTRQKTEDLTLALATLRKIIAYSPCVIGVRFEGIHFKKHVPGLMELVYMYLTTLHELTHLELTQCEVSSEAANQFAMILQWGSHLKTFSLSHTQFGLASDVTKLMTHLGQARHLKQLTLHRLIIHVPIDEMLVNVVLPLMPQLTLLDLRGIKMRSVSVRRLLHAWDQLDGANKPRLSLDSISRE